MPKQAQTQNRKAKTGILPKNIKIFFEKPFNASI
jgi:hypothetical protein